MVGSLVKRVVVAGMVVSAVVVGGDVRPAAAAAPVDFPAGLVCEFPVRLESGDDTRKVHVFEDSAGNVVRTLQTGLGTAGTLTNLDTGATFSFPAQGAVWSIVNKPNGIVTFTTMGHLILFLFPTDVPAGPSTTLYVGRVVFDVDTNTGVFTLKSATGKKTDLCAALST